MMDRVDLYKDIAERTQGDIYIGVVGPVRTGKSTFIKKFMDMLVVPNIENEHVRMRVIDELPQSGAGKTIMTTQPKFVPNEAVKIELGDKAQLNVRMVDCVGYMIKGALGHMEAEVPRMVRTPWSDEDMPFEEAAEMGTHKVITDHSTIGIVMTTDGSITDIPRSNYIEAEERVVNELKSNSKPFIIILNTTMPNNEDTLKLRAALAQKYDATVLCLDIMALSASDIEEILESVLFEFPLKMIRIDTPTWMQALPAEHWLMSGLMDRLKAFSLPSAKMRDHKKIFDCFDGLEHYNAPEMKQMLLGQGVVVVGVGLEENLFYTVLGEECGYEIKDDFHLITMLKDLIGAKKEYDRVADALKSVRTTGYGMVAPALDELALEEPEIIRQGNRFGVSLRANAPSIHMLRVDIESEVSPIVGSEKQSEELVQYLLGAFENNPGMIWKTDIFGKSLHDLVREGLENKLNRMPDEVQGKMRHTLERIINEGSGGLLCILL
jgi:stage IV sporulation protein A